MYSTEAYGRQDVTSKFGKMTIRRNECGMDDVVVDILYCGICHTDVTIANNEFGMTKFPVVPGHEISGKVIKVGSNVTKFQLGDKVGVGFMVDSCMTCANCKAGEENYCENEFTWTMDRDTTHKHIKTNSGYTFGGYSKRLTVHQRYAIKIPDAYPLEFAGPIFCSAVTMFAPLKRLGARNGGKRVGIIGIGGLGQMGISLAAAMGNEVTAISTSFNKKSVAKQLGAKHFIVSTDDHSMQKRMKSLDLILNTVSANHQLMNYLPLLGMHGTIVMLGAVTEPHQVYQVALLSTGHSITGSMVGGIPDTQEVMDFCAEKDIKPIIEIVTTDKLDDIFDILSKKNSNVVRYVLDLSKCE